MTSSTAPARPRWLLLALALVVGQGILSGCNSTPDKRMLQYLNTGGFGNRYTGNAEEENYVTIGDSIGITESYQPGELNKNTKVDIDGTVLLPEIGAVHIAGLTRTEIEALLTEKYSPYFDLLDIKVAINTQGKKFFVFGEVKTEGERPFTGDITIFEAVMKAVPDKNTANLGRVRLIRSDPRDPMVLTVNIATMARTGDSTFNVHIQENDIIQVPATLLAQIGYFIDTLLFPVKQVLTGLSSAIFSLYRLSFVGGGTNNQLF